MRCERESVHTCLSMGVCGCLLCGHHKNILAEHILLLWYTAVNMQ